LLLADVAQEQNYLASDRYGIFALTRHHGFQEAIPIPYQNTGQTEQPLDRSAKKLGAKMTY
jgi:hypothetical protein